MPQQTFTIATTGTPQQIANYNPRRKSLVIQNIDGANIVVVGDSIGDVSGLTGTYLYAYGSITYNRDYDDQTKARFAIALGGACVVKVSEEL